MNFPSEIRHKRYLRTADDSGRSLPPEACAFSSLYYGSSSQLDHIYYPIIELFREGLLSIRHQGHNLVQGLPCSSQETGFWILNRRPLFK